MQLINFNSKTVGLNTLLVGSLGYGVALLSGFNPVVGCVIAGTSMLSSGLLRALECKTLERRLSFFEENGRNPLVNLIKAIAAFSIALIAGYFTSQLIGAPFVFSVTIDFCDDVLNLTVLIILIFSIYCSFAKGLKAVAEKIHDFALGE